MELGLAASWLTTSAAVLAAALSIWNFVQGPSKKNEARIDKMRADVFAETAALDKRLDALEQKVGNLEQFVRQLPDRESFHELDKRLTEMGGKVDTISVSLLAQSKSLERIENFLIDSAKSSRSAR